MRRAACILIVLLLATYTAAHAQTSAPDPDAGIDTATLGQLIQRIEGKDRIRVSVDGELRVVERPVADAAGITYTTPYGQPGRVEWADVTEVEVEKRSPWLGTATGAAVGGGVGLLAGAVASGCAETECESEKKDSGQLALIGAGVGAVVGFVFGATRLSWSSVYTAEEAPAVQAMMSVGPGGVSAGLRLRI